MSGVDSDIDPKIPIAGFVQRVTRERRIRNFLRVFPAKRFASLVQATMCIVYDVIASSARYVIDSTRV